MCSSCPPDWLPQDRALSLNPVMKYSHSRLSKRSQRSQAAAGLSLETPSHPHPLSFVSGRLRKKSALWFMETRIRFLPPLALALVFVVIAAPLDAGTPAPTPAVPTSGEWDANTAGSVIAPFVSALAGRFGWLVQGFTVMALLRTVFKPVMTALETGLANQPEEAARLAQIERSWAFRGVAFALDLATSIKLHLVTPPPSSPGSAPQRP